MHPFRLFLLSTTTATALLAQGTPPPAGEEPVPLENFIVTAHPYGRNQAEIAQPTNVLSGTQLSLKQASSLGELLSGEVGVSSTWFGPGASRPIIRGLGGDRIRILENSTGTIDASVISPDHAVSIDPLLIERVEVVRGPASLLHGSTAVGGVVNVITHRIHTSPPADPVNGRVETRYNSVNDETAAGVVLEGGAGLLAWHLDAYRRETGDVRIPGFAQSARLRHEDDHDDDHEDHDHDEEPAFGRIPNTGLTADGAAFGLSLVGRSGYIGFSFSGHNTFYGIPAGAHVHHDGEHGHHDDHDDHHDEDHHEDHDDQGDGHGDAVDIDLHQRRFDLQGELRNPFAGFTSARFKFGTARYRHVELEDGELGTVFSNRGYDGRIELLHAPVGSFTGAFGVQAGHNRLNAVGAEAFLPSNKTTNRAAFLFEEAEFDSLIWQFGARIEDQDIALRDGSGVRRDDRGTSLSTALVWKLGDGWTLGSSLARTQRAPNAQELFSEGPHIGTNAFEIGDPTLRKENSAAIDVTLRKRTGTVTGAVTLFQNRFDGYIYEQATGRGVHVEEDGDYHFHGTYDPESGDLPEYRYIQRDARFHGAELEAIFHLHESDSHHLDLHVAADLVRGRSTEDRTDLPRITPRRLRAGILWIGNGLSLGADIEKVESQRRVALLETPTDGYTLVSAHAGYRFAFGRATCDIFVRGTNLGNREARPHTSFLKEVAPLPGRNVTAGVRLSF